jgi:hypothetical protein
MTEKGWQNCTDPRRMLEFLQGKASERKLRLFAVACCRRVLHLMLASKAYQIGEAIEVAERSTDGVAESDRLAYFRDIIPFDYEESAAIALCSLNEHRGARDCAECTSIIAGGKINPGNRGRSKQARKVVRDSRASRQLEKKKQAALLGDIFGNPFRPVTLDPTWLTWQGRLLVSMAQRMYDSRDFSDMPVLADALEEAGCSDQDILGHCRSGGEHVRGCWVVDLILGKT